MGIFDGIAQAISGATADTTPIPALPGIKAPTLADVQGSSFLGTPTAAETATTPSAIAIEAMRSSNGDLANAYNLLAHPLFTTRFTPDELNAAYGLLQTAASTALGGVQAGQGGIQPDGSKIITALQNATNPNQSFLDRGSQLYGEALNHVRQVPAATTALQQMGPGQINPILPGAPPPTPVGVGGAPFDKLQQQLGQVQRPSAPMPSPGGSGVDITKGIPGPFSSTPRQAPGGVTGPSRNGFLQALPPRPALASPVGQGNMPTPQDAQAIAARIKAGNPQPGDIQAVLGAMK